MNPAMSASRRMTKTRLALSDELLEDDVIGLYDELTLTRDTLSRRYDDLAAVV